MSQKQTKTTQGKVFTSCKEGSSGGRDVKEEEEEEEEKRKSRKLHNVQIWVISPNQKLPNENGLQKDKCVCFSRNSNHLFKVNNLTHPPKITESLVSLVTAKNKRAPKSLPENPLDKEEDRVLRTKN